MKNGHDIKHWLKSKKLWCWFFGVLMFHAVAVMMILYGMQMGATITEGIAGCLSLGYILGQASVDRALAGAADIAEAVWGTKSVRVEKDGTKTASISGPINEIIDGDVSMKYEDPEDEQGSSRR